MTVGELAAHNHTGSAATANITGQFHQRGQNFAPTGCFSYQTFDTGARQDVSGYRVTLNASHKHTLTINNTGSNSSHNNIQPYITCYVWRRTA